MERRLKSEKEKEVRREVERVEREVKGEVGKKSKIPRADYYYTVLLVQYSS